MKLNINDEAYFLSLADNHREPPELYWNIATVMSSVLSFLDKGIEGINFEEIQTYFEQSVGWEFTNEQNMRKHQILKQRFRKHPYKTLESIVYSDSYANITYELLFVYFSGMEIRGNTTDKTYMLMKTLYAEFLMELASNRIFLTE